jgi:glycosyltransferase involved in cell wall biosynthesis
MVARLEGHKDQPTLIKATAILKKQGIQILVRLIGEGSKRPELEQLIQSLGLEAQVTLLGMRRDIPEQLSQMDLFIFAAKPDEGFGIALAEAMAAGVPIVATNVGACREVLQDGRCGLLVKTGDPQALADGIAQVLSDRQTAQERAKLAKERALTDFGIATMADRYLAELSLVKSY